ncbi:MAG TPA: AMP-binding protein, partial [Arenibaculum sp.]|nr:AMP-binding protein [Arenibaculum sp.]
MTETTDTPSAEHGPARPRVPAATTTVAELEAVYRAWTSLPAMFFEQAAACAGRPLLHVRRNERWHALTWSEVAERVRRAARGLRSLGVEAGDRVVIVSENRPEWLIADMAIMAAVAITVPAYTTATPSDLLHVLRDSGARFAIVSTPALFRRLLPAALQAPELRALV